MDFLKKLEFLITQNKENLLDSHLKYGGVRVTCISLSNDKSSIEVELDTGSLAFSLEVDHESCFECGNSEFHATQEYRVNIIVNQNGEFLRNRFNDMERSLEDADVPKGPFSCTKCSKQYSEIKDGAILDRMIEITEEKLRELGVGLFNSYDKFEEAVFNHEQSNN
jgi:hypothetical protein